MARHSAEPRQLDPDALGDHVDWLYAAAWGLCGSREDAEDLVQETFLQVLSRPRFLRDDADRGYLMRALRNTYFTRWRKEGRRPRTVAMPDEPLEASVADPHAALEAAELLGAIARLPAPFREALVSVDVAGLGYNETARALGVAPGTVASRLSRARRLLVAQLEPAPQAM